MVINLKISRVIEKVDEWQPNVFGVQDKLDWCYEVTCNILNECPVYKVHDTVVLADGGVIALPLGVTLLDVAELYVNGKRMPITNATDYNDYTFRRNDLVRIVYRSRPDAYEADENEEFPDELETVCPAPFESMYVDFVCAQIAFQQNDAVEYNKFIGAFNDKFYAYKKYYGSNAPHNVPGVVANWY